MALQTQIRRGAPQEVLRSGLITGSLFGIAGVIERLVAGSTILAAIHIGDASAIAIYAITGVIAGTIGGMGAVSSRQEGRRPAAVGIVTGLTVGCFGVVMLQLLERGHVDLDDLGLVLAGALLAGLFPWIAEWSRVRGQILPHSELYEPPPKVTDETVESSEFDLS